ncbi:MULTISPECIES: serine protease [unclassified Novosphingobium]|uniref:S1 family peptidase n=1 Tax=unclassified Novosphingobium TaxID=2644732 RepID=UPI001356CBDD|nr:MULTISPECIES: serine protease [unclassified Novosphingobium]
MKRLALAVALPALAASVAAHADCTAQASDPHQIMQLAGASIVKIETISNRNGCATSGTGFIVSTGGHVLTAGHVIPADCLDMSITAIRSGFAKTLKLELVERSALDAAVLKIVDPPADLVALPIGRPIVKEEKFNLRDVTIVSFYDDLLDAVPTGARIDAVTIKDQPNLWALCAVAANPGRSGSPVMTVTGSVLAIFVEKPGNDKQDLARVLPLHRIKDLPALNANPPVLRFSPVSWIGVDAEKPKVMTLDFFFNDVEHASRPATDTKGRFLSKDQTLTSTDRLNWLEVVAKVAGGAKIRFANRKQQTFNAPSGYSFDSSVFKMRVESYNPRFAKRPEEPCAAADAWDCYSFAADGKTLTMRYTMYAGPKFDEARGWVRSSITTQLNAEP